MRLSSHEIFSSRRGRNVHCYLPPHDGCWHNTVRSIEAFRVSRMKGLLCGVRVTQWLLAPRIRVLELQGECLGICTRYWDSRFCLECWTVLMPTLDTRRSDHEFQL
jgi:hypothetical protein